jgi:hypothetical protein
MGTTIVNKTVLGVLLNVSVLSSGACVYSVHDIATGIKFTSAEQFSNASAAESAAVSLIEDTVFGRK